MLQSGEYREQCGLKENVVIKIDKGMLKWFLHMARMNESKLAKNIYSDNVEDNIGRDRPRRPLSD